MTQQSDHVIDRWHDMMAQGTTEGLYGLLAPDCVFWSPVVHTPQVGKPITRAEIEDIRGVETSKGTLDTLLETEWVRMRGRRKTPGRPVTYGTTDRFLDHFALEEIRDLPGMEELKGAGLLSTRMPANFSIPLPPADPDELTEDEDPLTDIDLEELGLLTPRVTEE